MTAAPRRVAIIILCCPCLPQPLFTAVGPALHGARTGYRRHYREHHRHIGTLCRGFDAVTAPVGKSAAVGLYVSFFYLGGAVGGWLPGLAYEAGGWPAALALVMTMLGLMALIVATTWKEA